MKDFSELFADIYNNQQDQWEKALQAELKLEDVSSKILKNHLDLGAWPILSLTAPSTHQLQGQGKWKKASQSYYKIDSLTIEENLKEDMEAGVRAFFFEGKYLSEDKWKLPHKVFSTFPKKDELEVYVLGSKFDLKTSDYRVIHGKALITAQEVHERGAHNVQELAVLTLNLIESLDNHPSHIALYMDSHFFKNIAKIRAMKLLAHKIFTEVNRKEALSIISLNSFREWTLYERYSNILRNNVQVASGYIGGADAIQSSGYQTVFELEFDHHDPVHQERSLRMARNTSHILGMESMLGLVEDASYGSYHLESLTRRYANESWELMQKLLPLSKEKRLIILGDEIHKVAELRLNRVKTRKDVLTGMNDYPDGKEKLGVKLIESNVFRVSRPFEELRLRVENLAIRPKVQILLKGDYGSLSNRINFIKNYFEVIGLEVIDPLAKQEIKEERIVVLCAKDEDYPQFAKEISDQNILARYAAGKMELEGFEMIYAGQNIFEVLSKLVQKLEGAK